MNLSSHAVSCGRYAAYMCLLYIQCTFASSVWDKQRIDYFSLPVLETTMVFLMDSASDTVLRATPILLGIT